MGLFSGVLKAAQAAAAGVTSAATAVSHGNIKGAVAELAHGAVTATQAAEAAAKDAVKHPGKTLTEAASVAIIGANGLVVGSAWVAAAGLEAGGAAVGWKGASNAGHTARQAIEDVTLAALDHPEAVAAVTAGGLLVATGIGAAAGAGLMLKGGGGLLLTAATTRAQETAKTRAARAQAAAPTATLAAEQAPRATVYGWPGLFPWVAEVVRRFLS